MEGMAGVTGLSQVLDKALGDLGLLAIARKYQVFSLWASIVGDDISRHARPRRLHGDILFVATSSSVWAQELAFMREALVDKVNHALGGEYIRDIRFSEHLWGMQQGEAGRSGASASDRDVPPADATNPAILDALFECEIPDPSLRRAFGRAALAMGRRQQRLTARGYAICKVCGAFYPSRAGRCPACEQRKEFAAYNRAIAILDRRPEMSDEEVCHVLGAPSSSAVARARRDLESRLASSIDQKLSRAPRGKSRVQKSALGLEVAEGVLKLAALRTLVPVQDLTRADLERAVGRRLTELVELVRRGDERSGDRSC